mmetsp:Transcript_12742/g.16770  ORF Transcript_12742/g.16770 Transcript_12742/m.16770 type:complete len:112 (+) Transcript_12742:261-596(+)
MSAAVPRTGTDDTLEGDADPFFAVHPAANGGDSGCVHPRKHGLAKYGSQRMTYDLMYLFARPLMMYNEVNDCFYAETGYPCCHVPGDMAVVVAIENDSAMEKKNLVLETAG